jgi:hypothetical protein
MMMRRREFIAGPGTAVVSPVVARGQESDRMRRVGVPMGGAESRVCALTAMLALIGALPALALDWQVKTKPGKEVVAHRYTTGISKTCRILGLPKITITVKPLNGSVDIRKASAIALTARRYDDERDQKNPCVGMMLEGYEIYYTPNPDFRGTDRVSYIVAWPGGGRAKDTVEIDVKE